MTTFKQKKLEAFEKKMEDSTPSLNKFERASLNNFLVRTLDEYEAHVKEVVEKIGVGKPGKEGDEDIYRWKQGIVDEVKQVLLSALNL